MLRRRDHFWIERVRRQMEYERGSIMAVVTYAWPDGTYNVTAGGSTFKDCANGTPYVFAAGDRVVLGRVGGARGNRHVIVAQAGRGLAGYAGTGGGGGSPGGSATLSEVSAARSSEVYGDFGSLDERLEAGDAEVEAARHGYDSLSEYGDALEGEIDGKEPALTKGNLTATAPVLLDQTRQVIGGAAVMSLSCQMSVVSDAAGVKLSGDSASPGNSKLYGTDEGGAKGWYDQPSGGGAELSDDHPVAPGSTPDEGTSEEASRSDHRHIDLAALCEQMLDLVLRDLLDTKTATKGDVSYYFSSNAAHNNGIATWSGAGWASATTYRYNSSDGEYFELAFVGDQIVLWQNTGHTTSGTGAHHAVLLDGAAQADWNQDSNASYTLTGLSYGVHVVRVTVHNANGDELHIGEAVLHQLPYQGVGMSGDAISIQYFSPWVYVTTIGTASTNNGGYYPASAYGEAISPRLPLSGNYGNDRILLRDLLDPVGGITNRGLMRLPAGEYPIGNYGHSGGGATLRTYATFPRAGLTLTLGTAATRGYQSTAENFAGFARSLTTAVIHCSFMPLIGRVTTVGGGSNLTAGELVLCIIWVGLVSADTLNYVSTGANANYAIDFFKVPSSLL